jgi:acetylornithine deacetylase
VLAKRLAGRNDHTKVAYGTEAGLFVTMGGMPTVVVGPGSIGQAHIPNEFIEKSELVKCGVFLDRLIEHCRS